MKTYLITFALLFACLLPAGTAAQEKGVGKPFPSFKAKSMDGQSFSSKGMQGKVTFVNFWFEQCKPCVAEFSTLNTLYTRFKDHPEFRFISFTFDPERSVNESIAKHRLLFPVCAIPVEESMRLNLRSPYPTNMVIDQHGTIVLFKTGGRISEEDIAEELQPMIDLIARLLAATEAND